LFGIYKNRILIWAPIWNWVIAWEYLYTF